jgi:hypothetical protein
MIRLIVPSAAPFLTRLKHADRYDAHHMSILMFVLRRDLDFRFGIFGVMAGVLIAVGGCSGGGARSSGNGGIGGAGGGGGLGGAGGAGGSDACAVNLTLSQWDVNADFSAAQNPCGVWTYGYTAALGSSPLTVYSTRDGIYWIDPNNVTTHDPTAWQQNSSFNLHPGPLGEYSTARWTAPRDGTYTFVVGFFAGDPGETNGAVLHKSEVLFQASTTANPSYSTTLTMTAGDTVDVAVGLVVPVTSTSFLRGTTPVSVVVTSS